MQNWNIKVMGNIKTVGTILQHHLRETSASNVIFQVFGPRNPSLGISCYLHLVWLCLLCACICCLYLRYCYAITK